MKLTRFAVLTRVACIGIAAVFSSASAHSQSIEAFQWISEEYAPYNFSENGIPRGIAVDVLTHIWERIGLERKVTDIQILPWARGYRMAQEQPGTCLFSMTVTEPRRELFAFAEPLIESSVSIVAARSSGLEISSIDDLASLTIGVVREDIGEQSLLADGAQATISRADSARSLVRMLTAGRFDAIAYGMDTALWNMQQEGIDSSAYESVFTLREGVMGYACHKDTDPAIMEQLQQALDALVADGTVARIRAEYLR